MNPIRHDLQEGETGDVIPHELLTRGKNYANFAIDHLHKDHADKPERYGHDDIRFATASACIEFFPTPAGDQGARLVWNEGFRVQPAFMTENRLASSIPPRLRRWLVLFWELDTEATQIVTVGVATEGVGYRLLGNKYRWDFVQPRDNRRMGRLDVGSWEIDLDDDGRPVLENDHFSKFRRIYLMVRTPR